MRLIQITDCHLGPLTSETLLGLNTDQSLEDVLQLIQSQQSQIDFILCSGDIASSGHLACYKRFVATLRRYFAQPLAWLPGNHDSAEIMAQVELQSLAEARLLDMGKWMLVLLDTSVPGQIYGQLAASELDFLAYTLAHHQNRHFIISLHHQLVPVGSRWIDEYTVRNAQALFDIVDQYPQVKIISWGHVHQEYEGAHNGISLFATPSTCVQFKVGSEKFAVDHLMPGYRWFELYDDGTFITEVERVTDKQYVIDYKSAGY